MDSSVTYTLRATPSIKKYNIAKFDEELPEFSTFPQPIMMYREPEKVHSEDEKEDEEPAVPAWRRKKRRRRKDTRMRGWIMEDANGQNKYNSTVEGGQQGTYMVFVRTGADEFNVIPIENWFRFRKALGYRTLTLEEAEEMNNLKKRSTERWLMKHRLATEDDSKDSDMVTAPRVRTGAVMSKPKTKSSSSTDNIFEISENKGRRTGFRRKKTQEGDPTGEDGGDFQEKFDDDESETETTNQVDPVIQSESESDEEIDGTNKLTETGQAMKDLLKRHQNGEMNASGTSGNTNGKNSDSDSDKETKDDNVRLDLGGNRILMNKEEMIKAAEEKRLKEARMNQKEQNRPNNKRSLDTTTSKSSKDEPPTKVARGSTSSSASNSTPSNAQTSTTNRLTEAAVQQELLRYAGRMKTKDLLKKFKKLLLDNDEKALFRDILRTICTVEVDPIDGRILVLKPQFM